MLRGLWTCRRGVPRHIRFDPDDVVVSVEKRMVLTESTGWLPIEEQEALELLQDSIDWVENVAPDVAQLIATINTRKGEVLGKDKKGRTWMNLAVYEDLAKTESFKRVRSVLGQQFPTDSALVRNAYRLTLGASLNMIFGLIGMRSGEVACLARQCGREEGQSHEKQYRIRSIESKRHRDRSWVTTEFAKPAIDALQSMFPWVEGHDERLLHVFRGKGPVPLLNRRTAPLSVELLGKLIDQFASSPHRGRTMSSPIHPHRWRHTFARFVMNRDKSALGALAEHYGHVYLWVTDGVYSSGRDKGMLAMLNQSQLEQMRAGFAKLLSAPIIAGKGSAQFENMRREVRQRSFQGKLTMEAMIEEHIKRGILKLAPCSWGYCVYEQSLSACKGTHARPNEVTRNPSLCGSCSNFVVTPVHRPFWEDRCRSDAEFLAQPDLPEQSRAHVQSRMVVSEEILRKLLKNG
jgi:integrase